MTQPRVARPTILEMPAYVPGQSAIAGKDKVIKLSSNENPFGTSPQVVKAVEATLQKLHRYPESNHAPLQAALATANDIDAQYIMCGAGSDEVITLICQAFAREGSEVLYSAHGFLMYPMYARVAGAVPVPVPEKELTADVDAFLARVTPKTSIVFIANPNNPTGTYLPYSELERLQHELPSDVLLVIDEAYVEYADAADYGSALPLVDQYDNVVVIRTFSKLYGIPSLRLGWCYGSAPVMDILHRIRSPFNVSSQAMAAGLAALEDSAFNARCVNHNSEWRAKLTEQLAALGLKVYPSQANFILIEFAAGGEYTAEKADEYLKSQGIIVRRVQNYGLPNHLRITVGTEQDNMAVLSALQHFMRRL